MGAIKTLLIVIFLTPIFTFGQNSVYPKDTIYVKYEKKTGNKKLSNWKYKNKDGISFSIKDISGKHISLFYEQINKPDTLCMKHIKEYKFLNLKEIRKKEIDWVNRKFKGLKYKPYFGSKNGAFQTYLIEVISKDYFVIYPVRWRNERIVD